MEPIHIQYNFEFMDSQKEVIDLYLDAETLDLLLYDFPEELPSWAALDFCKCSICELDSKTNSYCPIAVQLVKILPICKKLLSQETTRVSIITTDRTTYREKSAQKGIVSLIGLIMATSGCPHTGFFKPMARYHLPFADAEETIYRAASMYLLAQYFIRKKGEEADLELEGLKKIYYDVHLINEAIVDRLRFIDEKEVAMNAVIFLDIFARTLPSSIDESLEGIEYLYKLYLSQVEKQDYHKKD
jgi:hypothetical protein